MSWLLVLLVAGWLGCALFCYDSWRFWRRAERLRRRLAYVEAEARMLHSVLGTLVDLRMVTPDDISTVVQKKRQELLDAGFQPGMES